MSPLEAWTGTAEDLFDGETDLPQPFDENGVAQDAPDTILTMDEKSAAKKLWAQWHAQEASASQRNAYTEANRRRRKGERYLAVMKSQDKNEWRVYAPPNSSKTPPSLNKSARLARRVVSTLFTDPPVPEATPSSGSDEDIAAAEFTTRWLQNIGSDAGLNFKASAFHACNMASTYRSVFRHWYVDPTGGGSKPQTIQADPTATTVEDATHRMEQRPVMGPDGLPAVGMDGSPVMETVKVAQPGPFVSRFVAKDGLTLTDNEADAKRVWQPAIRCDVLPSPHVRMVPEFCDGIADAEQALIVLPVTVGALKRMFPETVGSLSPEALRKVVEYRPQHHRYLVPAHLTDEALSGTQETTQNGDVPDDAMAFVLTMYQTASPDLENGAHVVLVGEQTVAFRGPLCPTLDGVRVEIGLPVDQFRQFREGAPDPYGIGLMDMLGSGDELLQAQLGAWIEHLDRFANRKTYVPMTSTFQPQQGGMPMGSYIPIPPGQQPVTEDVPSYPTGAVDFTTFLADDLNDESGLQAAGQGLDTPNVQSGFHASLVMERVQSALAELHQHTGDAMTRGWRIVLQLARGYFPDAQQMRFLGDDQTWKFQAWKSSDFGSTTDVTLQRASFTMMTPTQKSMVAQSLLQIGAIDAQQMARITAGNVGGLLSLQDDPFKLEVKRQIAQWEQGPEQGGQPFPQEPYYDEPTIGAVRHIELSRYLASTKSYKFGPEWRAVLVDAYTAARQSASKLGQPVPPPQPPAPPAVAPVDPALMAAPLMPNAA